MTGYKKRIVIKTGTATSAADIISSLNAEDFASCSLQLTGTFVGTVVVEVSNDGSTWVATRLQNVGDATNISGGITSPGIHRGPLLAKYVRARCSAYTSGAIVATLLLSPDVFTSVVKST